MAPNSGTSNRVHVGQEDVRGKPPGKGPGQITNILVFVGVCGVPIWPIRFYPHNLFILVFFGFVTFQFC